MKIYYFKIILKKGVRIFDFSCLYIIEAYFFLFKNSKIQYSIIKNLLMEDTMINQENTKSLEMDDSKNEKSDERKKFIRRPDLDVMTGCVLDI